MIGEGACNCLCCGKHGDGGRWGEAEEFLALSLSAGEKAELV